MDAMVNAVQPAATVNITSKPDWWPNWEGETIAVVASGPSAKKAGVEQLQGRAKVIAINESYQLCLWADMLYGCDPAWWRWRNGVEKFRGLKLCADADACRQFGLKKITIANVKSDAILFDQAGHIGAGGNSGFQGVNLAVQFGGCRILLIGFDMRIDLGEHWHERHYPPLSNPHPNDNLPRWRRALDGAAPFFKQIGIEVINCSSVSALKAYPKMTIAEALHE